MTEHAEQSERITDVNILNNSRPRRMLDCCVGGRVRIGTIFAITTALSLSTAAAEIVVARDGSGNFTSVQAAIDSVPADNERPVVIHVKLV
jgi:hypothetical protein